MTLSCSCCFKTRTLHMEQMLNRYIWNKSYAFHTKNNREMIKLTVLWWCHIWTGAHSVNAVALLMTLSHSCCLKTIMFCMKQSYICNKHVLVRKKWHMEQHHTWNKKYYKNKLTWLCFGTDAIKPLFVPGLTLLITGLGSIFITPKCGAQKVPKWMVSSYEPNQGKRKSILNTHWIL
jgi:hypothetical protein